MRRQTIDLLLTLLLWTILGSGFALATIDPVTNFADTEMSTGYDASATTVIVASGTGNKFPSVFSYPAVWWNCTDYDRASADPNVEIVSVTGRSGDTFTVTRGQEGTIAVTHNTAGKTYCFELQLTKGMWDRVQAEITASASTVSDVVDCGSSCATAVASIGTSAFRTLRLSSPQIINSNLSITKNITVECTGSGTFAVQSGVTLTLDSPEQMKCSPRKQIFSKTGSAQVLFINPGTVYLGWCGGVAGDGLDDSVAAAECVNTLPGGTNTSILEISPGSYTWNTELSIGTSWNGILIKMVGATLDIAGMTGTGTSGVHGSVNVLSAIKLLGANQRIVGGRITGPVDVNTTKKSVGILLNGATGTRISSLLIDGGIYAGIWAGNNTLDLTVANADLSGCGYGAYLGFASSPSNPQVTRATFLNVKAHNSTIGSGLLMESHARDVQIIGGFYYSNTGNGIGISSGGDRVQIIGTNVFSNSGRGIYLRYASNTGETSGKWGYARRSLIQGNIVRNNTLDNISIQLDDYSQFSTIGGIEEMSIEGNYSEGSGDDGIVIGCVRCTIIGNQSHRNQGDGFVFRSLQNTSIRGNQSWDNGLTSDNRNNYKFTTAATTGSTPPNSTNVTFEGNHGGDTRSGSARTVNYTFNLSKLDNSVVSGNIGSNANTADWVNVSGLSNIAFLQNKGTVATGEAIGTAIAKHLFNSKTYDPPSTLNAATWATTVTVTGAAMGDIAECAFTQALNGGTAGWGLRGQVTAADTVTCLGDNWTGGTVDLSSGTLAAEVWKH